MKIDSEYPIDVTPVSEQKLLKKKGPYVVLLTFVLAIKAVP